MRQHYADVSCRGGATHQTFCGTNIRTASCFSTAGGVRSCYPLGKQLTTTTQRSVSKCCPHPHSSFHTTCHPLPNSTHIHSSFSTLLEQTYVYARPRATKNFVPVPCFHRTSVNCSTAICREKLFRLMGNDVEHSPWEDDGFSASQETARILLNPKVY